MQSFVFDDTNIFLENCHWEERLCCSVYAVGNVLVTRTKSLKQYVTGLLMIIIIDNETAWADCDHCN